MEFLLLSFPTTAWTAIVAFVILFVYFLLSITRNGKRKAEKSRAAPEATGAWPLIGHLHLLRGPELPHKILGSMADKFGPIFTVKLGLDRALVVSNWEMAQECFTTNDAVFANRPKSIAVELLSYNYAMFSLSSYGPYWRQFRKISMLKLLSQRRLELLGHIRQSEVKTSIREIYELSVNNKSLGGGGGSDKVLVEMKKWFGNLTLNVLVRMIAGKRYSDDEDQEEVVWLQNALREFFELVGVILVSDSLPFLRWFDLGGYEKAMKSTAKEADIILQKWLDEHKKNRISGGVKGEQDFMDVMLSVLEGSAADEHHPSHDTDTINKATCLVALTGGIDATMVALTWVLSLLLNHPQALKKAQEELDNHIGNQRQVEESDMKNLIYLQAVIKEALRLYPPAPFLVPHESSEDCTVGGYHVPKGTRLLVNVWKVHRDPRVWSDPDEFKPDRFLTTHKDVEVRGQHFGLIPFGSGRRMCPGISLALRIVQLTLANLLHGFKISSVSNEPVDMTESLGLSNLKATPLEVLLTPRLSSSVYG